MNDIKRKQMEKMYQSYYASYNKGARQQQENKEVHTVQGLASWTETTVSATPAIRIIK